MKLYMKQKVFSWKDKFYVKDESGADRYYVEGEIFTLGRKLHVYDSANREIAFIRQKLFTFLPRYYIEIGGETIEVVKEFTFLKHRFHLVGRPWRLDGDFWAHEYALSDEQSDIMRLSKKWLTWGDSYELDIAGQNDEVLCLCIALTVDCVLAAAAASSTH